MAKELLEKAAKEGHVGAIVKLAEINMAEVAETDAISDALASLSINKSKLLKINKSCHNYSLEFVHRFKTRDADAHFERAECYFHGSPGVAQNTAAALQSYRKAAEKGHTVAQFYIAVCYDFGYAVLQDKAAARHWYEKAAGNPFLSEFEHSDDPRYLNHEAISYTENWPKAGTEGHADAQFNLALCFLYDDGMVAKNKDRAVKFYTMASDQGHWLATYNLACWYDGDGIGLEEIQHILVRTAHEKRYQPDRQNPLDPNSYYHDVSYKYYNKSLSSQEQERLNAADSWESHCFIQAASHYLSLAKTGDVNAQFCLAKCFDCCDPHTPAAFTKYYGGGAPARGGDARYFADWYKRAADQGHADAQFNLALCYYCGDGIIGDRYVHEDKAMAVKLYSMAASQGHKGAQFNLEALSAMLSATEACSTAHPPLRVGPIFGKFGPCCLAIIRCNVHRNKADCKSSSDPQLCNNRLCQHRGHSQAECRRAHAWLNSSADTFMPAYKIKCTFGINIPGTVRCSCKVCRLRV